MLKIPISSRVLGKELMAWHWFIHLGNAAKLLPVMGIHCPGFSLCQFFVFFRNLSFSFWLISKKISLFWAQFPFGNGDVYIIPGPRWIHNVQVTHPPRQNVILFPKYRFYFPLKFICTFINLFDFFQILTMFKNFILFKMLQIIFLKFLTFPFYFFSIKFWGVTGLISWTVSSCIFDFVYGIEAENSILPFLFNVT